MPPVLLHVLVGPPGAGKTSFARTHFAPDWIISADDVRESVSGWRRDDAAATWKYAAQARPRVAAALSRAVLQRLRARLPAVYDNTNLKQGNRLSLLAIVPKDIGVRYILLDRPLEAKLADRGWRPERLIIRQHEAFQAEWPNILAGDGCERVTVDDRRPADAR